MLHSVRLIPLLAALPLCASAAPDLIVKSLSLSPSKPDVGDGTVVIVFENVGDDDVDLPFDEFTNYVVKLDGATCEEGTIFDLDAGDTNEESTGDCAPSTPGPHEISVTIDSDGDFDESNESNNTLTKTFVWGGPDLVVTDVVLDPAEPLITEGTLIATIENQGSYGTDTFLNIDVRFFLDGEECADGIIIAGLGEGSTATEETTACNASSPGPHVIRVEVDYTDEVPEENEDNNVLEKTLVWNGGADLVFTDLTLDPAEPKFGDGTLTATVKNQGQTGTGVLVNINVTMYLDGEECDTGLILGGLGQDSTTTEETGSCNPETPGEHTIRFEVDTDSDVPEQDESNNSIEKTFTWTAADLVITDITASADPLKPGEANTFSATVLNQGPVGTGTFVSINLRMFLDGEECDTGLVIAGLGAGATATEDTTSCNPETGGAHTIRFEVDTDSDVVELDEENNGFEKTFVFCGDSELCNGFDDDCNGETDEGFMLGAACDGDDADECEGGITVCGADGTGTACEETGEPVVEVCNDQDDDCDGETDEDFTDLGDACVPDGACPTGVLACADDEQGTVCVAAGTPESCDGIDNDCDGDTDEDFPALGEGCAVGTGVCRAAGVWACDGSGGVACDADEGDPAAFEPCGDLLDDDCDGLTDEGCSCEDGTFVVCGTDVGLCEPGVQPCEDGTFADACEGATLPVEEVCDNLDNDCDATVDEGCPCSPDGDTRGCAPGSGACAGGLQTCAGGVWGPCTSATFAAETCDDVDNDCDGIIDDACPCDDGDTLPCDPTADQCADYERRCLGGVWTACEAVPGTEVPGCGEGVDGSDGTDGADGLTDTDGTDATDGTDGAEGTDATEGADGTDSVDGTDGVDGLVGLDGTDGVDTAEPAPAAEDGGCSQGRGGSPTAPLAGMLFLGMVWIWRRQSRLVVTRRGSPAARRSR